MSDKVPPEGDGQPSAAQTQPSDLAGLPPGVIEAISQMQQTVSASFASVTARLSQSVTMMRSLNLLLEQYLIKNVAISIRAQGSGRFLLSVANQTPYTIGQVSIEVALQLHKEEGASDPVLAGPVVALGRLPAESSAQPLSVVTSQLLGPQGNIEEDILLQLDLMDPIGFQKAILHVYVRFPSPGTGSVLQATSSTAIRLVDVITCSASRKPNTIHFNNCKAATLISERLREVFGLTKTGLGLDAFDYRIDLDPSFLVWLKFDSMDKTGSMISFSVVANEPSLSPSQDALLTAVLAELASV